MKEMLKNLFRALKTFSDSFAGPHEPDFEERRKRLLLAYFGVVGVILLGSLAFSDFLVGNLLEGTIELLICAWMLLALILLRTMEKLLILFRITMGLLVLLVFYVVVSDAGAQGSKLLWYFGLPPCIFFLLGKREGIIWNGLFLIATVLLLIDPGGHLRIYPYAPDTIVRFTGSFVIVSSLAYIFEGLRNRNQLTLQQEKEKLAQAKHELEEANQRLKEASERAQDLELLDFDVRTTAGVKGVQELAYEMEKIGASNELVEAEAVFSLLKAAFEQAREHLQAHLRSLGGC